MVSSRPLAFWTWAGQSFGINASVLGRGKTVLLLPAMSSISTRMEMEPLARCLASRFKTISVDWPGFGVGAKAAVTWDPAAYQNFLDHLLRDIVPEAELIIAAGHAAGYVLDAASRTPRPRRRLVLVAPTWRGPLPTMLGRRPPILARIARASDIRVLGSALYRLNVNPFMIGLMSKAHVFSDPKFLSGTVAEAKAAVTRATGARHAAVRFVTGELDPFRDRSAFLGAAAVIRAPILVTYGAETPPKSMAEMEALASLPGVQTALLPRGKLGLHEEFPESIAAATVEFYATAR